MSAHSSHRAARAVLTLTFVVALLAQCTDRTPAGLDRPEPEHAPGQLTAVTCTASVRSSTVTCASPVAASFVARAPVTGLARTAGGDGAGSPAGSLILGGQNTYVTLASGTVSIAGDAFTFPVTVQNLIGQALGTQNGVDLSTGVRVFFQQEPQVTAGTGTIALQLADTDGEDTFLAADQKYYEYAEVLDPQQTSGPKTWTFRFTGEPTFQFRVYVWAPVQHADGWVQVTPAPVDLAVGGEQQLTATVFDRLGVELDGAPVTWSTDDATVATVSTGGLVTGVASGATTIRAESPNTPPASDRTGAVAVTVGEAPTAEPDGYMVVRNGTLAVSAAEGLLDNDDVGTPDAVVTHFGGGSLGGAVTDNAAGATVTPLPGGGGSLTVNEDGSLSFTPPTDFTGAFTFSYRIANTHGHSDGVVTVDVVGANDDTYPETVLGNVSVNSANVSGGAYSVTANDAIAADATITFAGWDGADNATRAGGQITMETSGATRGRFTYDPPAGFIGTDSIAYTVSSGGLSVSAKVGIPVSGMIWFVDADAAACTTLAAGCGRLSSPFSNLGALSAINNGTGRNPQDGHAIFLFGGAAHTAPVTLRAGQRIIGQNASASLASLSGQTVPASAVALPAMGTTTSVSGGSGGVALGSDNTLRGFTIATSGGTAISGTGFGTLDVGADMALDVSGGRVFDLSNGTVTASLGNIGSATDMRFDALAGTLSIGGGSLTNSSGTAFSVTGGTAALTYGGDISSSGSGRPAAITGRTGGSATLSGAVSSTGNGILVQGNTGGTVTFSGTTTLNTGANAAVSLTSNPDATIAFTNGGLAITTTSGAGFSATGGGTVSVSGTGNTISAAGGIGLRVENTTSGGLTFESISADGGANGIVLQNTGVGSGLTVTGTGLVGSGGTIRNIAGADGAVAGNAVYLSDTRNISLSWMNISGVEGNGIFGTDVHGLTVFRLRSTGNIGTSNSGTFNESVIHLQNASGPISIRNSLLNGAAMNAVRVHNTLAVAIDSLVMENDTVTHMQGSTADVRGSAMLVHLTAGTGDIRIRSNHITYWWGNAIHSLIQGTAAGTSRITGNFADNTNGALAGAGGIGVAGGTHAYNISGNTVRHTNGTAISADRVNAGTTMQGTIENNTIGVSGDNNSGTATGAAIFASHHGPATTTHRIRNNVIRQAQAASGSGAIWVLTGDAAGFGGSGALNATITGNDIQESGTPVVNAHNGILITVGVQSGPPNDTDQVCLDIGGSTAALRNTIANFNNNTNRIRVNARFGTTSRFPGYTGAQFAPASNTDLASYLLARNNASTSINANSSTGGFNDTVPAGSACPQPSM